MDKGNLLRKLRNYKTFPTPGVFWFRSFVNTEEVKLEVDFVDRSGTERFGMIWRKI